jgi:hypothetical protein
MQVYRGMDIGTAKPSAAERAEVPYHLLDLADPSDDFALPDFQAAMVDALAGIEARGHRGSSPRSSPSSRPNPTRPPCTPGWSSSTPWPPDAWNRPTGAVWSGRWR